MIPIQHVGAAVKTREAPTSKTIFRTFFRREQLLFITGVGEGRPQRQLGRQVDDPGLHDSDQAHR
jgi:hypothetical protein